MKSTIRSLYPYLFGFSLLLLGVSFILQFLFHLQPCPLCIIDRIIVFFLTIFFAIAILHNPERRGQQLYSLSCFGLALLGILSAARHLWIIHLPPEQVPECGPGLNYLFGTLPPKEAFMVVLQGSGECAVNNSAFLGLSLPSWTLLAFIVLAIGSLLPMWSKTR